MNADYSRLHLTFIVNYFIFTPRRLDLNLLADTEFGKEARCHHWQRAPGEKKSCDLLEGRNSGVRCVSATLPRPLEAGQPAIHGPADGGEKRGLNMGKDASHVLERTIPGETTVTTDVERSPPEVANYKPELQR